MNEVDIENKETDETGAVVSGREILESDSETLRHSEGEGSAQERQHDSLSPGEGGFGCSRHLRHPQQQLIRRPFSLE